MQILVCTRSRSMHLYDTCTCTCRCNGRSFALMVLNALLICWCKAPYYARDVPCINTSSLFHCNISISIAMFSIARTSTSSTSTTGSSTDTYPFANTYSSRGTHATQFHQIDTAVKVHLQLQLHLHHVRVVCHHLQSWWQVLSPSNQSPEEAMVIAMVMMTVTVTVIVA